MVTAEQAMEALSITEDTLRKWDSSRVFSRTGNTARPYFLGEVVFLQDKRRQERLKFFRKPFLPTSPEQLTAELSLQDAAKQLEWTLEQLTEALGEQARSTSVVTPALYAVLLDVARHFRRAPKRWDSRIEVIAAAEILGSQSAVGLYQDAGYLSAIDDPAHGEVFLYRSMIFLRAAREHGIVELLEQGDGTMISTERALEVLDVPKPILEAWSRSRVFAQTGNDTTPYFLREVEYLKSNL